MVPGKRRSAAADPFEPFVGYCRAPLADDPHRWAATLLDEIAELGYDGGYSTFTRALRRYQLRPHCERCQVFRGRDVAIIAHRRVRRSSGTGWSCRTRRRAAGAGKQAHLLVGALAHSSKWCGVLAEAEEFPHLVEASTRCSGGSVG